MARDKGLVYHDYFAHITPGLDVPLRTIILTFVFNVLFGLLYLGPSVAFGAYISSCTIFLNVSYVFPVIALLIRGRSVLKEWQNDQTPFALGKWGWILNWVATIFVIVTSVFFTFPAALPASSSNMNYVSAVIGIFLLLIGGYWFLYGQTFEGPKFDLLIGQHQHHVDESVPVSGKDGSSTGSDEKAHKGA
ncbi:hypothetical protein O1611_g3621 [Lasiodiplodia mahajangana]|uniref:Uncharacterized protein n=1 Tax=Lasiodiplodia mahajangana TaxID=1108764 RepID=A0ACC2JR81_9PEZI|nr:hypothetical protein O1611_g3621 [Lasiodiplodia mahajangana]